MFRRRQQAKDPYHPFQMGIQSYSLRGFGFEEALKRTRQLGLEWVEAFPMHFPYFAPREQWASMKEMVARTQTQVVAYGVVGFGADEKAARGVFEFAKAMGIKVITADPEPESFRYLARLCEEFRIPIAIHNHGPNTRYDTIRSVVEAMRGQPDWIGACIDTGHYLRSGEDPVEAVRRFGKRVYGVHLKDVKNRTQFTVLGKGDLDTVGFLRALKQIDFKYCLALEYEENPKDPIPDIQACLDYLKSVMGKV
ncbi:MAG: sugar phosphate isomerase/epimerase [Armatimonadetes bacterium]|nr:sugar phosphate isomerase/epimerase [Armatimonadota bacterium]CUU35605.1 Sugar phosphate isomerase/epimerase [Armatimonadetes bacterium DC]